jgi:hypothetical protein
MEGGERRSLGGTASDEGWRRGGTGSSSSLFRPYCFAHRIARAGPSLRVASRCTSECSFSGLHRRDWPATP